MVNVSRTKIGTFIGVIVVAFIIFCTVFLFKKIFDNKIEVLEQEVIIQKIKRAASYDNDPIINHELQYHKNNKNNQFEDHSEIQLSITQKKEEPLSIIKEDQQKVYTVQADYVVANHPIQENAVDLDLCSFVTMPIPDNYIFDIETQNSLDILIGNDFNQFIKLIIQSNNDVVSQRACRSCVFYAFFKKIKKHKNLTTDEIQTLQHIIGNLYRFIETMKKLSSAVMMSPEQYSALQDLNRPQILKNSMKLQARKTAAARALRKLQSMKNR